MTCSDTKPKPQILILGGQQFTGLASELIHSRYNTCYQNYDIVAVTKPHALSKEVLKSCCNIEDSASNYIILCVGENDCNPYELITHLASTLQSIKKMNVIVMNILHNRFINEKLLNNLIYNICFNFPNCQFINFPMSLKYNKKNYLLECCKKINFILDMQYYKKRFLTFKNIKCKKSASHMKRDLNVAKKGTIPYYFPFLKKDDQNTNKNCNNLFFLE